MKVEVKTLGGNRFEIEANLEDTVADLKKNIETVKGPDVYPGARQMLIHGGKVLEDDTTLEEIEVVDNDFIVIMLSPRSRVAPPPPPPPSSTTDNQEASRDLPPVTEAPPPPPVNPERAESQSPDHLPPVTEAPPPPPAVNQERAESQSPDLPPVTEAPPPSPAVNRPQATQPPSGPNTNPLNIFPHDRPAGEPVEGEEAELEQLASAVLQLTITREDMEALDRLQAMGFSRALVMEAYFVCDRNEEQAAHYLRDYRRYFEED